MAVVIGGVEYLTEADSVNASSLRGIRDHWGNPFDSFAAYINGWWPDFDEVKAEHPDAHLIDLTVHMVNAGDGADDESGDLDNQQAAQWAQERLAAGVWRPIIYGGCAALGSVVQILASMGIARSQVRLWSAHYWQDAQGNDIPHICGPETCKLPGCPPDLDGTQWSDQGNGGAYDESLFVNDFFGAPTPPTQPEETPMDTAQYEGVYWLALVLPDGTPYIWWENEPGSHTPEQQLRGQPGQAIPSYGAKFTVKSFTFEGKPTSQLHVTFVGPLGPFAYNKNQGALAWSGPVAGG